MALLLLVLAAHITTVCETALAVNVTTSQTAGAAPCMPGGSSCATLWNGFQPGAMTYDGHGGAVNCDQPQSVQWNGNEMTISYLGNRNTCYARTAPLSALVGGAVPNRVLISAMIKVDNKGCDPNTIWPAFWLVGTAHAAWPGCGEIDIAERQNGITNTHLIGANGPGGPFVPSNMITYGAYPGYALAPDGQYHKYGFEWNFHSGIVDFTSWMDNVPMGTKTCQQTGQVGTDLTCTINFKAIQEGYHKIVFDVDTHGSGTDHYSMSIKDLKVERVLASESVFV